MTVHAGTFLERVDPSEGPTGADMLQQQRAILAELEDALGSEHRQATEARLGQIEDALRPTFAALPKGVQGTVGAPGARYALHRLFVNRHGWQVKGLEPGGEAWTGVSPAVALGERVPSSVRDLFEERVGRRGLDLHELAVLASTLENLIHGEAVGRLRTAYELEQQSPQGGPLTQDEVAEVTDTYMAIYIMGANVSAMPRELLQRRRGSVKKWYPSWPETQRFLREVQREVAPVSGALTFDDVTAVVEEVGERFGRFQDAECRTLKSDLVGIEEAPGSGRVRLADFYGSALRDGKWQFSEKADYLREPGALDDSDPSALRVIIPNYLNSASNCLASSAYYGVCCIDECEALLGHLERRIGAPTGRAAEIAELVAALPSASQPANRTLPAGLVGRLEQVAEHHGGRVPLHGRLFAQWLHHAYPRECPYPHVSGTTRPERAEVWQEAGREVAASEEEMRQHVEAGHGARRSDCVEGSLCSDMWTMEEELVDRHAHQAEASREQARADATAAAGRAAWRSLAALAALASLAATMAGVLRPALALGGGSKSLPLHG